MNLSRAYTLRAARGGSRALLTVGRVQTPTLALVVARDKDIESFKSQPYYTIKAAIQYKNHAFVANWRASDAQRGLDSENRLVDTAVANALIETLNGAPGHIVTYKQEPKTRIQPRAYSLSDITLLASSKYGFSAAEVLDACQALYETHKLTSYPRTDCAYLPESQHADAPDILEALSDINPEMQELIAHADTRIKSKTWDDAKVGVHHGIIPTRHRGNVARLSNTERAIYELIVRAYIAQFYPVHEFLSTTVEMDIKGETFETRGNTVIKNGWRDVYTERDEESENEAADSQTLPMMQAQDAVICLKATRQDLKTKPAPRFTEGTLQRAMENIHKFITEPEHKKMLKEGDGIGTSATRASIISELKRRNYLEVRGKQIISTTLGRSVIGALPEVIKNPVLTAIYERMLRDIEKNPQTLDGFIERQVAFVTEQVARANNGVVTITGAKASAVVSDNYRCTECQKGLVRRPGRKGFWWSCSSYPECRQTWPDIKGKPDYNRNKV